MRHGPHKADPRVILGVLTLGGFAYSVLQALVVAE